MELIGTLMFVYAGAGAASSWAALDPGAHVLAVSAVHAIITVVIIRLFGSISGGHFNAGPTLCGLIFGELPLKDALFYLISQCCGCLIGAAMLLGIYDKHNTVDSNLGTPFVGDGLPADLTWENAFAIELFGCTLLGMAAYRVTHPADDLAAFIMGGLLFTIFVVAAPMDGSAMNVWRWFGPAAVSGAWGAHGWVFIVATNLGWVIGYTIGYGLQRM